MIPGPGIESHIKLPALPLRLLLLTCSCTRALSLISINTILKKEKLKPVWGFPHPQPSFQHISNKCRLPPCVRWPAPACCGTQTTSPWPAGRLSLHIPPLRCANTRTVCKLRVSPQPSALGVPGQAPVPNASCRLHHSPHDLQRPHLSVRVHVPQMGWTRDAGGSPPTRVFPSGACCGLTLFADPRMPLNLQVPKLEKALGQHRAWGLPAPDSVTGEQGGRSGADSLGP